MKGVFHEPGTAKDPSENSGRPLLARGHHVRPGPVTAPREAGCLPRAEIRPSGRADVGAASVTPTADGAERAFRIIGGPVAASALGSGLGAAGRDLAARAGVVRPMRCANDDIGSAAQASVRCMNRTMHLERRTP